MVNKGIWRSATTAVVSIVLVLSASPAFAAGQPKVTAPRPQTPVSQPQGTVPTLAQVQATVMTSHVFTAADTSAFPTIVNGVTFSDPIWKTMSPQDRAALLNKLGQTTPANVTTGMVSPNWYIGLGWNIYFHDLSPTDQRWFLQVGVGSAAIAICAASAGALCVASSLIALAVITGISEYYHSSCWITVVVTYSGVLKSMSVDHC